MKFVARALVCGTLAIWQLRMLFEGGLFYRHDWAWPVTLPQLLAARLANEAPWNANGLGAAAIAPLHHPVFNVWSLVGPIIGTQLVLPITLCLSLAAIGVAVASIVGRLWQAPEWLVIPAALLVQVGAPLLNKVAAGHTYYLVALAALAWAVRATVGGSRRPITAFAVAGLFVGFSVLQIQLFVIAIVMLITAAFLKREVPFGVRLVVLAVAIAQLAPSLYAAAGRDAPAGYEVFRPQYFWELSNSSPFPDGLYLLGYAPHYAEHALAVARTSGVAVLILQLAIFVAILALLRRRDSLAARLLAGAWSLGVFLVLGLNGPLSGALQWLFADVPAFGVFRELYHFAAPAWLAQVVLLIGAGTTRTSRLIVAAYCITAVFVLGSMWSTPHFGGALARVPVPRSLEQRLAEVRSEPGDARFLLWPAEWPVAPKGTDAAGNDPAAYPIGMHPVANEFRLGGPLEVASALVREGKDRRSRSWFAAAGVDTVVNEPWLTGRLQDRAPPLTVTPPLVRAILRSNMSVRTPPSLGSTCLLCAYASLSIVPDEQAWNGNGDAFLTSAAVASSTRTRCRISLPFVQAMSPGSGWKPLADWSWLDARLAMFGHGVVTWGREPLVIPRCNSNASWVRVLLLGGSLRLDGRNIAVAVGRPQWLHLTAAKHEIAVAGGGVLAVGTSLWKTVPKTAVRGRFQRAPATLSFTWYKGTGQGRTGPQTRWIVLKTTYSPHWRLSLSHGRVVRHVVASGYANGWLVTIDGRSSGVRVWYDRWSTTETIAAAVAASWWLELLLVVALLVPIAPRAVAQFQKFR